MQDNNLLVISISSSCFGR